MKKYIVSLAMTLVTAVSSFAQVSSKTIVQTTAPIKSEIQTPSFRNKGYKGSVSYTNSVLVWNGIDTSHGYMFNEHHYLGGGLGFFLVPTSGAPTFLHIYADYHAYWFDRASTPVAGIKLGYARLVRDSGCMEIEPTIGWNWGLKSGKGLTLSLGAKILGTPLASNHSVNFSGKIAPMLSFAFEF